MNILVIGGSGPLGGYTALHLQSEGHEVTISSRRKPAAHSPLSALKWVKGNYLEESFSRDDLTNYDAIVFAAGSDPRHVPEGADPDEHFLHANGVMVPKFAELARSAGVKNFIHIGSFYGHVLPGYIETNPYVRSRHLAAKRVCDLSTDSFRALSLDAPFVVGVPGGMKDAMWMAYMSYARGLYPEIPVGGPAGGTNFISVRTLAQAVSGALASGTGGKAYLLGDENLSFSDFFAYFFKAVGNPANVTAIDGEHPMLPDIAIMQGRGNFIDYQPDPADVKQLGYARKDVGPFITEMIADLDKIIGDFTPIDLGTGAGFDPELRALADSYCRAVDRADKSALRDLFTQDAVLKGPGFRHDGIEEILTIADVLPTMFLKTRHVTTGQIVEINGKTAKGETLCTASHLKIPGPGEQANEMIEWQIRYQDQFIKQNGKWRIKHRALILDWIEVRNVHTLTRT